MKKYTYEEHLISVIKVLHPASFRFVGGEEDWKENTNVVMIAYERFLNDRNLMLSEQTECGQECFLIKDSWAFHEYDRWDTNNIFCAVHSPIKEKLDKEFDEFRKELRKRDEKKENEYADENYKKRKWWTYK